MGILKKIKTVSYVSTKTRIKYLAESEVCRGKCHFDMVSLLDHG